MSVTPIGDPDAIGALASGCINGATQLASISDAVNTTAQSSTAWWQAPRADRFRSDMANQRKQAQFIAGELHAIGIQLKNLASSLESELSLLGTLEAKVLAVIKDFVPAVGKVAPWLGTPWSPGNLPASGDPAWQTVARDLGI